MNVPFLDLVIFTPLAGALLLTLVPKDNDNVLRWGALGITLLTFVLSVPVLIDFSSETVGFQLGSSAEWISDWGISYITGIDGISLWMVMLTTFLMPLGVLASWTITKRVKPFFVFLLALETGMLGVFCSLDLFLFYLFWEVTLVPMYFLIGMWGYERRIYAAMKFFLFTLVGSLLMLAGILYIYFSSGGTPTFDLQEIASRSE